MKNLLAAGLAIAAMAPLFSMQCETPQSAFDEPQLLAKPRPPTENLLKNAAFENHLAEWQARAGSSWTAKGGVQDSGALVIHADRPPDDGYIHETIVEQCVPLTSAGRFRLSAQVRLQGMPTKSVANRANIIWFETLDCSTGGEWGAFIEPKSIEGWQLVVGDEVTPALGAKAVQVTLEQNGKYSNGNSAFWDDVVLAPTRPSQPAGKPEPSGANRGPAPPPGTNYVVNGRFDADVEHWRQGWKCEWSATEGATSHGAARVVAVSDDTSAGDSGLTQCVNIRGGTTLELGANFKRDESSTQTGGGRLRVTWYAKPHCTGASKAPDQWADTTDAASWQKLRVSDLAVPPEVHSANVEIIQAIDGRGHFTAYWDDVYLTVSE